MKTNKANTNYCAPSYLLLNCHRFSSGMEVMVGGGGGVGEDSEGGLGYFENIHIVSLLKWLEMHLNCQVWYKLYIF